MNIVQIKDYELCDNIAQEIIDHPGMISRQERKLLYALANKYYRGEGCIIDAGTFLGASTVTFYQALKDRKFKVGNNKPIQSFELAVVRPNFDRHAQKWGLPRRDIGESYEDILRQQLAHTMDYVELHIGNILDYDASDIDKIEIAFLDILKNEQITEHCFHIFLSKLIEGGVIIQQDYFFDDLPFIKYMTEALDDHLEYNGEVRSSAVFTLRRPLDEKTLNDRISNLNGEDKLKLHSRAEVRTVSRNRQYLMKLSRARLFASLGRIEEARKTWARADMIFEEEVFDKDGNVKNEFVWRHERLNKLLERKEKN